MNWRNQLTKEEIEQLTKAEPNSLIRKLALMLDRSEAGYLKPNQQQLERLHRNGRLQNIQTLEG